MIGWSVDNVADRAVPSVFVVEMIVDHLDEKGGLVMYGGWDVRRFVAAPECASEFAAETDQFGVFVDGSVQPIFVLFVEERVKMLGAHYSCCVIGQGLSQQGIKFESECFDPVAALPAADQISDQSGGVTRGERFSLLVPCCLEQSQQATKACIFDFDHQSIGVDFEAEENAETSQPFHQFVKGYGGRRVWRVDWAWVAQQQVAGFKTAGDEVIQSLGVSVKYHRKGVVDVHEIFHGVVEYACCAIGCDTGFGQLIWWRRHDDSHMRE